MIRHPNIKRRVVRNRTKVAERSSDKQPLHASRLQVERRSQTEAHHSAVF
jgi:hypothetical protein